MQKDFRDQFQCFSSALYGYFYEMAGTPATMREICDQIVEEGAPGWEDFSARLYKDIDEVLNLDPFPYEFLARVSNVGKIRSESIGRAWLKELRDTLIEARAAYEAKVRNN